MRISALTHSTPSHASAALAEAERLMIVCNACRYCEGLCAVFPAMEMRRTFADADLNYLANLCHGCGACYFDCQFSPPHEFNVNVPKILAQVRNDSYRAFTWPNWCAALFERNGLWLSIIAALGVAAFRSSANWLEFCLRMSSRICCNCRWARVPEASACEVEPC